MTDTEIIEALIGKLSIPTGRHLYGILGSYPRLVEFATKLQQASLSDGTRFPAPLNVNRCIMDSIPDMEFKRLAENEAKLPEPVESAIASAFDTFMRELLKQKSVFILSGLELLFSYSVEFSALRTMATDQSRVILLLPGKRTGGQIIMYPGWDTGSYILPLTLIAQDHLWELKERS